MGASTPGLNPQQYTIHFSNKALLFVTEVLPEAIKTSCEKCTGKQKDKGAKAIKFMIEKKPELWKEIAKKYDPSGTLTKKFTH